MKKNNFLTDNFAIQCNTNVDADIKLKTYIKFLNNNEANPDFTGDSYGSYYGIYNGKPFLSEDFVNGIEILALDDWYESALNHFGYVNLHSGERVIQKFIDVVELTSDFYDDDTYALRSECVLDVERRRILKSDSAKVFGTNEYFHSEYQPDYVVWSEAEEEYLDCEDSNVYYGYVSGGRCEEYFYYNSSPIRINGEWFKNEAAAQWHNYTWSERCGEWIHEDDWNDEEHGDDYDLNKYNASYHDLARKFIVDTSDPNVKFTIGFEIEKEDSDAVEIPYRELYDKTKWAKESDGSLDDEYGYELVTPVYNLFDNRIDEDININNDLQTLINAESSSSCGGHINIASTRYSPQVLFEHISGWFPLFYSLYENRLEKSYSAAKKKHKYYDRDKYSAFYIKSHVLEIRIPSAVKNVNNLLWRRDLMRIICESIKTIQLKNCQPFERGLSEVEVLQLLMNPKSKIHKHLRKVFTYEKLLDKIELFVMYSESYNDKVLPKIIRGNMTDNNMGSTEDLGA